MNELEVVVQEEPCQINWNFEDLKNALAEQLQGYETMVYDDDSIPQARADVANLRKLRKAVEDKRIETKKACMEPYNVFEEQVKEIVGLIDEPIGYIDGRIKGYEEIQKEKRREDILAYIGEGLRDVDGRIVEAVQKRMYDPRWENKTCSKKKWQEEADNVIESVHGVMEQIREMPAEFMEPCTIVYEKTLDPASVMAKENELQAQKEAIQEAMNKKIEAENKRIQEQEIARLKAQAEKTAEPEATKPEPEPEHLITTHDIDEPEGVILRINGTDKQIEKIKGYITFVGAGYEEVRA